jgi:hypothetical protein
MLQLTNGLLAVVVGEQSCPPAGRVLAELNVAGPHAAERQVFAGSRAGGSSDVTRRPGGCYCERVSVGAAAASRAWPPALREWWHTCRRCGLPVGAKRQLTNACS